MSPETRDFLDAVRGAEGPTPDAEVRILAAIEAAVGVTPTTATSGNAAVKGVAANASVGFPAKVLVIVLGVSVGGVFAASAISSAPSAPVAAQVAPTSTTVSALVSSPAPSTPPLSTSSTSSTSSNPAPAQTPARLPVAKVAVPSSLREELALLAAVQSALERGDGAEALRRLDEHDTNDRQLSAERRAARISALCLLGRVAEARQVADLFFRHNAGSVQRAAVERSCAAGKPSPAR